MQKACYPMIAWGIIFAVLGLIMEIKPISLWPILEKWKSENAEGPSNLYVFSMRLGGAILLIVSGLCLWSIFM
ncbi:MULTISPECIES: DUF6199 family natural product biosynthesis protein [Caproicibacterium]|uniref:DUF6199 family natural product biosynthesis protein n=1 Tax=Caproicibacterium TaxID=2834348 RepID=UPI0038990F51